jgi:small subunit ribosomal protein S20
MPTTKSAKKRLRQSLERRAKNRSVRSSVKTQVRKVREAVAAGDLAKAETELRLASKKLDRAGSKRVIHANAAARTKSRLQHLIKVAKTATPATA